MTTLQQKLATPLPPQRPPFHMEWEGWVFGMNRSRTLVFLEAPNGGVRTMSVRSILEDYEIGLGVTTPQHIKDAISKEVSPNP